MIFLELKSGYDPELFTNAKLCLGKVKHINTKYCWIIGIRYQSIGV